ncbi:MAG TPA: efflux RND transporter permease subunit, partial [Rhizomicrobium sp.]|nr:efflux RND transporter permease subunit [Rhizomicrobium sp.]
FMGGIVGRLLHEFAVTIVLTILISGFVSVTLTPMLCSRFLKAGKSSEHGRFYQWSEKSFAYVEQRYEHSLKWCITHSRFTMGLFVVSLLATGALFYVSKQDFIPSVDTGQIQVATEAADRVSFDAMTILQRRLADIASRDSNVQSVVSSVGSGGGPRTGTNTGTMLLKLKSLSKRSLSADEIIQELRPKLQSVPGINAYMQNPPSIRVGGHSSKSAYQYTLQDTNQDELDASALKLLNALSHTAGFADVTTDMDLNSPAANVDINRDQAAAQGVSVQSIETALGASFGGEQISTLYASDAEYWVMLELEPQYQRDPSSINLLYVSSSNTNGGGSSVITGGSASNTGGSGTASNPNNAPGGTVPTIVPLNAVTDIRMGTMPLSINHLGQLPSVTISFNLLPGFALSDAVTAIAQARTQADIPTTVQGEFEGTAQAFQSSLANIGILLTIAILTVYIILGILYESFVHPLTILSGLPSAAVGALITLLVFGIPLSLYAFVGMIMLIGIVKKNAIMMIDFALNMQRSGEGATAEKAIYEACLTRFRPIMMTTMAAMMGTMPIALGMGVGAASRRPLGLCVAGGLLLSQLLTLYITPVIFIYLDQFRLGVSSRREA